MNRPSHSDQLSGIFFEGRRVKPFALVAQGRGASERAIYTTGTYLLAGLPKRVEADITMAVQPG